MNPTGWSIVGIAIALVGSWPLVQRLRHPRMQPIAAYMVFLSVFAVVGGACLTLGSYLVAIAGWRPLMPPWAWFTAGLVAVLVPGLGAATLAIRREPRTRKVTPD